MTPRLPASLQRAVAFGPVPLRGFVFTPASVFGHEVNTTESDATQNDYYQDDGATHTRYPFSDRETSIPPILRKLPLPTIRQVEHLGARLWGIAFRAVLCFACSGGVPGGRAAGAIGTFKA
jgi:hypothetical protein